MEVTLSALSAENLQLFLSSLPEFLLSIDLLIEKANHTNVNNLRNKENDCDTK